MEAGFEQRVRDRAYELWVAAGMEDGMAELHWLAAEKAVMSEGNKPAAKASKMIKVAKPAAAKAAPARKSAKTKQPAALTCSP